MHYKEALKCWFLLSTLRVLQAPQIDAQKTKRKFLDVSYASQSPNQLLDIYLPPEGVPDAVCPRRRFFMGDKRDAQLHCRTTANRGYAVAQSVPAGRQQYPPGCSTLRRRSIPAGNASKYMLDGDRLGVCGDSAGGFYAVMTRTGNPAFEDLSMGGSVIQAG